jgi:hypothetical protein
MPKPLNHQKVLEAEDFIGHSAHYWRQKYFEVVNRLAEANQLIEQLQAQLDEANKARMPAVLQDQAVLRALLGKKEQV